MKPDKIYVVFKTHVDLGFTDLPSNVVRQYKTRMMDDVLTVCEATAHHPPGHRYVWTLPAWMLMQCLDEADPDRKARLEKLVREGQLCWHGLPFTTHTEFCGVEEFLRGLYWNEELCRKYGRQVISAKMTDVPGHTWMLPSLLRQAGIRFLHLGVNACSSPVELPRLFWWEGPDGSRVLTWYSAGEYGTSLLPPDDWPYPVWLALMQTHDNIGPQSSGIVRQLLDDVAAKYPDTEVWIGTMDDFATDFLARGYEDIPVVRKDLADTWIHGIGTYPAEVARVRQLRYDLASAEAAGALLRGNDPALRSAVREGYEHTLLFGEHTWGIDIKSNLLPGRPNGRAFWSRDVMRDREAFPETYAKTETSWEEQRAYVRHAESCAANALPVSVPEAGGTVAVVNTLPRERRSAPVRLPVAETGWLRDPKTGERIRVRAGGEGVLERIGPLEARRYIWEPDASGAGEDEVPFAACTEDAVLENEAILCQVSAATGHIVRLYDKRLGKEWAADGHFGAYRYELYGKPDILHFVKKYAYDLTDWYVNDFGKPGYPRIPHAQFGTSVESVEYRRTDGRQEVRIRFRTPPESREEFGNAGAVTMTVSLDDRGDGLDVELRCADKKPTAFAEAGFFVMPLSARRPRYRLQKMGAVIDPLADIARGANHRLHCVDQWIGVEDEEAGLAVFPLDTPLCSLGEPGIYQYDSEYRPERPVLFFNLFNNQWGTNFPQWIGGEFRFRFRIVPYRGDWKRARLEDRAEELRHPLRACAVSETDVGADSGPFLTNALEGVRWLALKPAEDGTATICRFMNATDEHREIALSFRRPFNAVFRCSGVERVVDTEPLPLRDGTITLHVRPFEMVTLKLCP